MNQNLTDTPQRVDQLITSLEEEERTTYHHILQNFELTPLDFENYTSWSDKYYTRNCIVNNEKFELILICWCKGHKTPIHDHGGEECWVKVIGGELEELIYQKNEKGDLVPVRTSLSKANQITYMKDFMGFHSLENIANKKSLTLHLYAKPIRKCNIFDSDTKSFVETEMFYHTTP